MGHPSSKPCTHPTHHLEPVCHVRKDLTPSELDGHKSTFIIDIHTPLPCQQHQEILKSPSVSVFPISPPTSTQGTISPASLKGLATAASAARSEAGSTRWRCSRVCSGQLINTSSSCKILNFKKTHYKMHPQLSNGTWRILLPGDSENITYPVIFGANIVGEATIISIRIAPFITTLLHTSSHPACHLLGNKQNPYCWRKKNSAPVETRNVPFLQSGFNISQLLQDFILPRYIIRALVRSQLRSCHTPRSPLDQESMNG